MRLGIVEGGWRVQDRPDERDDPDSIASGGDHVDRSLADLVADLLLDFRMVGVGFQVGPERITRSLHLWNPAARRPDRRDRSVREIVLNAYGESPFTTEMRQGKTGFAKVEKS